MRAIDAYLWVLTCRDDAEHGFRENGTIVGCVTCGGLPTQTGTRVTFSIDPNHLSTEIILRNRKNKFVLNLLDVRQYGLVQHFGLQSGRHVDKFNAVTGDDSSTTNVPFTTLSKDKSDIRSLIMADTCAWLECEILHVNPFDDRIILVVSTSQTSFVKSDHLSQRLQLLHQYLSTKQLPVDIKCPLSISALYALDPNFDARHKQSFAGHANSLRLTE